MLNAATRSFIADHRGDDVYALSLKAKQYPDVDIRLALQQIEARQRCAKKLPTITANDDWVFPPRLSLEQCSSEETALYKAELISHMLQEHAINPDERPTARHENANSNAGATIGCENKKFQLVDLTGGMGIDTFFASQHCSAATYVERDEHLCELAKHNFSNGNINVVCCDSTDYIRHMASTDVILIDPARRDNSGRKVAALSDCSPDITTLWDTIRAKSRMCIVKISPMLDATEALRQLPEISETHYVGAAGECKEILLVWHINATGDVKHIVHEQGVKDFIFTRNDESAANADIATGIGKWLHVPSATMLKAAPFTLLAKRFGIKQLAVNTHFYTSDTLPADWHGKSYQVEGIYGLGKSDIKQLRQLACADITVRNAPLSPEMLRKKLNLKEGGTNHLFACSISDGNIRIIHCKK